MATWALIILAIAAVVGQDERYTNLCDQKTSCDECIQQPGCAWCSDPNFDVHGDQPRCNRKDVFEEKNRICDPTKIEYFESHSDLLENNPLDVQKGIQIQPQHVQIGLSVEGKDTSSKIFFEYIEGDNKPLDLYYLMDLSQTMSNDKDTVSRQGRVLAVELRKLTKDVRLGFGSFIDKPIVPFVSSLQLKWSTEKVPPYGFRNHLNLTHDVDRFVRVVNDAKISANVDAPEGGLDAVMQAMACTEEIGWRPEARKLIVVATDGPFHTAGDGKILGLVHPNDKECHLKQNEYEYSKVQDYPSIAQINQVATEKQIYAIFAVEKTQLNLYKRLSKEIRGSEAARLDGDSQNVVNLVKEHYQKISGRVEMNWKEDLPPYLDATLVTKCPVSNNFENTRACDAVTERQKIEYALELRLLRCPRKDEKVVKRLKMSTFELSSTKSLSIDLEYHCNCGCSVTPMSERDWPLLTSLCNGNAHSIQCGLCQCHESHRGRNCECSKFKGKFYNESNCIKATGLPPCSGGDRGVCECGRCKCNTEMGFSGKFCECSQDECKKTPYSEECSGHGVCDCGRCNCDVGYEGPFCGCSQDLSGCIEPALSKEDDGSSENFLCNGAGDCVCNEDSTFKSCLCQPPSGGVYCELCLATTCSAQPRSNRCEDPILVGCVECIFKKFMKESDYVNATCPCSDFIDGNIKSQIQKFIVEVVPRPGEGVLGNGQACQRSYNSTCDFVYSYNYVYDDRNAMQIEVQEALICPPKPPILWYSMGVLLSVLAIGLITLFAWRILIFFHDRREFYRFEKERAKVKWGTAENPLYNTPMTTFSNPSYRS